MRISELREIPDFKPRDIMLDGIPEGMRPIMRKIDVLQQSVDWTANHVMISLNHSVQLEARVEEWERRAREMSFVAVWKIFGFMGWMVTVSILIYNAWKK